MLFNSFPFLCFLLLLLSLYYFLSDKYKWMLLLVSSYVFYCTFSLKFFVVLLISTALTYTSGLWMAKIDKRADLAEKEKIRKKHIPFILCIVISIAILCFYKYIQFFLSILPSFSIFTSDVEEMVMPIGLSFYTFQALGYVIDVYKGKSKAESHLGKYALFVSFFPQLMAGPIEKANDLIPQFYQPKSFNYARIKSGLILIAWGLFRKMVIADRLGIFVDGVYDDPTAAKGFPLIIASYFFLIQVYLDFAAYSEIAIGIARVFGYTFTWNFRRPLLATSFGEFWRRWHITLIRWFIDYIYIPLGGNRQGNARRIFNVLLVFLISGIWHGPTINFVFWGLLNGLFVLLFDRLLSEKPQSVIQRVSQATLVVSVVAVSSVLFRAASWGDALFILQNLGFSHVGQIFEFGLGRLEFQFALLLIGFNFLVEVIQEKRRVYQRLISQPLLLRWILYLGIILTIALFGIYSGLEAQTDFIYFQF